jgi:Outer membrane protein beta-barrel domain
MADRNFEQKVSRRMDDFKLNPSDAVWIKVDAQLRKDKRRRWLFFFILPLMGLLCTGIGIGVYELGKNNGEVLAVKKQNPSSKIKFPLADDVKQKQQTPSSVSEKTANSKKQEVISDELKTPMKPFVKSSTPQNKIPIVYNKTKETENLRIAFSNLPHKKVDKKINTVLTEEKKMESKPASERSGITANDNKSDLTNEKSSAQTLPKTNFITNENIVPDNKKTVNPEISDTVAASVTKILETDSTLKSVIKNTGKSSKKWKFGLQGGMGLSGSNFSPGFGEMKKSLDASSQSIGGTPSIPPIPGDGSKIKSSFSFNIGVAARKSLGKRTSLVTGMRYQFASTKRNVGGLYNSPNNLVASFRDYGSIRATEAFGSGDTLMHKSHYHLFQLPVLIEYAFGKKKLLSFNAGITPALVLKSDALAYNSFDGRYYSSADLYKRFQLFASSGILWKPTLKSRLQIGPEFNFGVINFYKQAEPKHKLFTAGFQVRWWLK